MDARNRFETRTTFLLHRLEWLAALAVSTGLALTHLADIRWPVFVGFFVVIDLVGYLPGAIAYRVGRGRRVARGYYVAYNVMHSLVTGAALVGLWSLTAGPEWALLAVPIHLFGDRALFGNSLKPFRVSFEPEVHPAFATFEESLAAAGPAAGAGAPAGEPVAEHAVPGPAGRGVADAVRS